MLMHESGLANHHNPPNFLKYMLNGVGIVLRTGRPRIVSVFRTHAVGDFVVVYRI